MSKTVKIDCIFQLDTGPGATQSSVEFTSKRTNES